jgi:hypothetical protein
MGSTVSMKGEGTMRTRAAALGLAAMLMTGLVTGCTVSVNPTVMGGGGDAAASSSAAAVAQVPADESGGDLADYSAQMSDLAAEEADLIDRYGAVTGENYTDDATMYDALSSLLPDVQIFIGKIEALQPPAQAAAAHATWIEAWNLQSEGMTLAMAALDKQDYEVMTRANEKLADGRAMMRDAAAQLQAVLQ